MILDSGDQNAINALQILKTHYEYIDDFKGVPVVKAVTSKTLKVAPKRMPFVKVKSGKHVTRRGNSYSIGGKRIPLKSRKTRKRNKQ